MPNNNPLAMVRRNCPLCGKPMVTAFRPFCSRGCRDRDLNAWFGEGYRIPARTDDPEDDEGRTSDADPAHD